MNLFEGIFFLMNLNFFYWIPIVLFGSIYLIKLSKDIYMVSSNQVEKNS